MLGSENKEDNTNKNNTRFVNNKNAMRYNFVPQKHC